MMAPRRKRGEPPLDSEGLLTASRETMRRKLIELNEQSLELSQTLPEAEQSEPQEITNSNTISKTYSEDRALANFVDCNFTRVRYENNRAYEREVLGENMSPSYKRIQAAKERCYPEDIEGSESQAKISIQSLLNHSFSRLLMTFPDELIAALKNKILKLLIKWGMDGLSALSAFKQRWKEIENRVAALQRPLDTLMFLICMVPLKLVDEDNNVIWKNPTPSSTRYCRPIEFEFPKETTQNTIKKYEKYQEDMDNLQPFSSEVLGPEAVVTHECICSIIDGKTCNALTGQTCSNNCNVCRAKPSQLDDLKFAETVQVEPENLRFGLSPLHCRIRFMELCLCLAYIQDYQMLGGEILGGDKEICALVEAARQKMIQTQLQGVLGIGVDIVETNYGTSNDGNTSRRFFEDLKETAKIVGLDLRLIEMFKVILEVLNSPREINVEKYSDYCNEAMILYKNNYDWYPLPPSVHKALMHRAKIIEAHFQ
ncbi:hypothetical protein QAD02_008289 [Eretmocerus hayati]|uniref:Uncharacterized protein n=1 Tax=Eretmocerus hayati TaxID=131215 RepID=A0ACC2N8F5_9HYME|nr:hypothetical protein QAD02_008289 [Eretmocerus hayati]